MRKYAIYNQRTAQWGPGPVIFGGEFESVAAAWAAMQNPNESVAAITQQGLILLAGKNAEEQARHAAQLERRRHDVQR